MCNICCNYAGVAELADALDLGSSAYGVGVQIPSPAPKLCLLNLLLCGSGSVVERHLAKVNVAGSNPVFRSKVEVNLYICGCNSMVEC